MAFFHIRIAVVGQHHDEVKTDLNEETLEDQFLTPYRAGWSITVNGKTLPIASIERIRISTSQESSARIIDEIKNQDLRSSVVMLTGPSYEWRAAAKAYDVTDEFITGPPGQSPEAVTHGGTSPGQTRDARSIFVVQGRDSRATGALIAVLHALGLNIVEWEHAVVTTGVPNPYVGDVVEAGLRMATAAVVVITPDDVVRLRDDLIGDADGPDEREVRGQARPNVYYEAGFADAIGCERTVIVEIGQVKSFSDAAGRHVIRYDGSPAKRHALAERLRLAGLVVDTTGQDWLSSGDVAPALAAAEAGLAIASADYPASSIQKEVLITQIDALLANLADTRARSKFDDLSDLPQDTLQFVVSTQALMDRSASGSLAGEAARVANSPPHERFLTLEAVLCAWRQELSG